MAMQAEAAPEEQTMDISHTQHGNITAAVPRLADILNQGEATPEEQTMDISHAQHGNITAAVPRLADILGQGEAPEEETMDISRTQHGTITAAVPRLADILNQVGGEAIQAVAAPEEETMDISHTQHGSITAAVPRLADILNQGEATPEEETMDISHAQHGNITAAVPRLADILNQGEAAPEEETMDISHTQHGNIKVAVPRLADILNQGEASPKEEIMDMACTQHDSSNRVEALRLADILAQGDPSPQEAMDTHRAGGGNREAAAPRFADIQKQVQHLSHAAPEAAPSAAGPVGAEAAVPLLDYDTFLEMMEMQFLPTRRHTSMAGAVLTPALPEGLREGLAVLCVTVPEVQVYGEEVARLNGRLAELEALHATTAEGIGQANPPLLQEVAHLWGHGEEEALEGLKQQLKHLKARCRTQAKEAWQHLRLQLEERIGQRLLHHRALLNADLVALQGANAALGQLTQGLASFGSSQRQQAAERETSRKESVRTARACRHLRAQAGELDAANSATLARLEEAMARRETLQQEVARRKAERDALQIDRDREEEMARRLQTGGELCVAAATAVEEATSMAEEVQVLQVLHGWQVEMHPVQAAGEGISEEAVVQLSRAFLARVRVGASGTASVMLEQMDAPQVRGVRKEFLLASRAIIGGRLEGSLVAEWDLDGVERVRQLLVELKTQVAYAEDLIQQLESCTVQCPGLAGLECKPLGNGGGVALTFEYLHMELQCQYEARLELRCGQYPHKPPPCQAKVIFAGTTGLTASAVSDTVAGVPAGDGQLLAIHRALEGLLKSVAQPGV
ncbi:hypothetical protein CYMTET_56414 [Cymbomonas tetramitiformis]|uniref:Spc7 kinetochore protein domain-containing protein n=1 Tax=Cymbomonas tetramitiformis TaxID=36881 RepID=A0AAE0BC66_9CHLO|nr:hypothetical protein CYMTET_56414 [Cymbomonas tetramitiformis]